jgi:hypothetical protein
VKVGDLVVRAYVWDRIVPGIIVDEDLAEFADWNESQDWYTVAWSDGMLTNETRVELEHWEDMTSESR